MMTNMRRFRKTMATAILLFLIGSAAAAPPEVRDDASFFSPTAVAEANGLIRQLKQRHGKDLQVETFPEVPANLKDQFQKNKNKTFADWAVDQSKKVKVDGVYILICKNPGHLEVLVGDATLKKAFPAKDRDALRDLLLKHFKDKTYDDGLMEAVLFVKQRFEQNIGTVLPAATLNSVQDHGVFFSAKVVDRGNSEIKEIHLRFKKDVVVETFAAPPEKVKLAFDAAGAEEKNKIIANWANDRAREAKVDGVLILVCRNPSKLQVVVDESTLKKALVAKERDQMAGLLIKNFKTKEFDKALSETLDFVFDAMDRNLSPSLPTPTIGGITGNFAVETAQKATREIEAIGKNVTIDSLSQPPPGQWKQVEAMTAEARAQFFADLLKTRSAGNKADGIYVMICRQPINVQVALGATIQQKAFTPANRDELVNILTASLQAKELDKGLFKGLEYVGATLAKNMPTVAIRTRSFGPIGRACWTATVELTSWGAATMPAVDMRKDRRVPRSMTRAAACP